MLNISQAELGAIIAMNVMFDKVPLIQGAPGIGKTHMIRDWCDANGYTLLVELLSTSDPMMFRGLQGIDSSGEEPTTVDCVPAIIKKVRDLKAKTGKPVLLFLDEITLAPPSMQGAALTFIQDREINGVSLPSDTRIVSAGNSAADSSAVYDLTGPAQNRVVHYYMQPTFKAWKQYMLDTGGHALLLGALETNDTFFFTEDASEATGPFPSPRQWSSVSELLNYIDETGGSYTSTINKATIFGLVGSEAGSAIVSTMDLADGIPTPEQIMSNPKGAIVPDNNDRKRLYLTMSVAQSMIARAQEGERKNVSDQVFKYMDRMPEAFMISFCVALSTVESMMWTYGYQAKYIGKYAPALGSLRKED